MAVPMEQQRGARRGGVQALGELWQSRDLIWNLVVRDLKVRYKHSALGVLWSLLNPLLIMVVFTLVFTVMQPNASIPHFAVFILAGLLPWNLFSGSVMGAASQIISNGNLIKKVWFPREVLPLSMVLSNFINFLIGLIPLALFLALSGIGFTRYLLWLPLIMLIQLALLLGLGFLLSTLTVFYRDMLMVLDVALLGLFFMTPIFYPMELIQDEAMLFGVTLPINRLVRWFNPMASIVDAYRTVIYGGIHYQGTQPLYFPPAQLDQAFLLRTGITALAILLLGWWLFRRYSPRFGEEV